MEWEFQNFGIFCGVGRVVVDWALTEYKNTERASYRKGCAEGMQHRGRRGILGGSTIVGIGRVVVDSALAECRNAERASYWKGCTEKYSTEGTERILFYVASIFYFFFGIYEYKLAVCIFCHQDHTLAVDAAHFAGGEIGYECDALSDDIFGLIVHGNT
jgi:hypothetical protein